MRRPSRAFLLGIGLLAAVAVPLPRPPLASAAGTGTWEAAAPLPGPGRFGAAGVLLTGAACAGPAPRAWCGKVLMTGGLANEDAGVVATARVDLFDPATGGWRTLPGLREPRAFHTATVLADGRVLVAGGLDPRQQYFPPRTELFDPASESWAAGGTLVGGVGVALHTATLLRDGRVLLAGGRRDGSLAGAACTAGDPSSQVYAPSVGRWSPAGCLATPRSSHTATLLGDGRVLVAGGENPFAKESRFTSTAELYIPDRGWQRTASLATPRAWHTASVVSGGRVLVAGGENDGGATAAAEAYDATLGGWEGAAALRAPRSRHGATSLVDGSVLVAGGTAGRSRLASAELFDAPTGAWQATAPMRDPRASFPLLALPGGTAALAAGGQGAPDRASEPVGEAEIFKYRPPAEPGPGPSGPGDGPRRPPDRPPPGPTPAGCSPSPALSLSPPVAATGFTTTVRGTGFCAGPVTLGWDRGLGGATAIADATGSFTATLLVFTNDVVGARTVRAVGVGATAGAPFLVVPSPALPPGFVARR